MNQARVMSTEEAAKVQARLGEFQGMQSPPGTPAKAGETDRGPQSR